MLTFKGVAKLFEDIEQRLIGSLKRNLSRHKTEEKKEGFKWSAWQAEKLRNIEKFRRENRKIVKDYADVIDRETRQLMEEQFREGEKLAEREVTEITGLDSSDLEKTCESRLPTSDKVSELASESVKSPAFGWFGVNSEKMDKLITDITELEKNAESAALRMTDDIYRQTLHRAQLEMGTGSMTINQAVDMATREFLDKGINCIVYKDGKRVNIADYVRMALRTTSTRAQLQGKAKRFAELGYDTVLISQYGMCSKTCLPWQGKVYIDDVFTVWDGEKRDGMGKSKYCGKWFPLLSVAMEAGLFHPNCRHTMSLWIEGVSKMPEPLNEAEIKEKSAAEQKQRELERKIRKHKRQVVGSTDEENVKEAKKKLREAQKKLKELIDEHDELRRDYDREKIYDTAPSQPQDKMQKPPEQPQSEIIPPENEAPQRANVSVSEEVAKPAADIPETATESQQGNAPETVDKSAESGIIEAEKEFDPLPPEKVVPVLREESEQWIEELTPEEVRAVKKYTKNSGDPKDDKFYARLNAMLRGEIPENDNLRYYANVISGALKKFTLKHDIVCFRALDFNPYADCYIGQIITEKQFISTSARMKGALKKNFTIIIKAPKDSNGAYIELLSKYSEQREFLFDKNTKFKILQMDKNKAYLEVIV